MTFQIKSKAKVTSISFHLNTERLYFFEVAIDTSTREIIGDAALLPGAVRNDLVAMQ